MTPPTALPARTQPRATSFYSQLREQVLQEVVRVALPGDRVPSERQLARQFETSAMTISRILQEFQESGLVQRVPGKGTFICGVAAPGIEEATLPERLETFLPGPVASGPGEGLLRHTCIICHLSSDPPFKSREYWSQRVVSAAERRLQKLGTKTTLLDEFELAHLSPPQVLQRLREAGADSVLYLSHGTVVTHEPESALHFDRLLLRLKEAASQPLTVAHVSFAGRSNVPFDAVTFDGARGSFLATRHLLELGHTEICFLARGSQGFWEQQRLAGFWQAMSLSGLGAREERLAPNSPGARVFCAGPIPAGLEDGQDWAWSSTDLVRRFFEQPDAADRFTAVVAVNDQVAGAFIDEARQRGKRVPEDYSVVGFDDRMESRRYNLTTVHPPIEEMGEAVVALMNQRHRQGGQDGKLELALAPSLVVRDTTQRVGAA